MTGILRLDGVTKNYGAMTALARVDLTVERGEFVTLLGPSGSGKTTLLNLVAGTIAPSEGRIFIDGRDATDVAPARRGLGMVFQNYALMPHMTVFENIAFPLRIRKVGRAEIKRRVAEALELVRLPDVGSRKPRQLSGGQQQRIALARCLVYNPSLILMDEPLGALDKRLREQIQIELQRLHAELGITVLFVTHDQEEALNLSDRIVLMNRGRIEQEGTPDAIYQEPRTVFAADFLGDSNLIDAEVIEVGNVVRLRALGGRTFLARPSDAVRAGARVKMMVRPENVSIEEQAGKSSFDNLVDGVLETTHRLGSVVKHFVRVGEDLLLAKQMFRPGTPALPPGSPVRLGWRVDDLAVLPLQEAGAA